MTACLDCKLGAVLPQNIPNYRKNGDSLRICSTGVMKKAFNRNLDKIRLPYRTVNMTVVNLSGSQTVINGGTPACLPH